MFIEITGIGFNNTVIVKDSIIPNLMVNKTKY